MQLLKYKRVTLDSSQIRGSRQAVAVFCPEYREGENGGKGATADEGTFPQIPPLAEYLPRKRRCVVAG